MRKKWMNDEEEAPRVFNLHACKPNSIINCF